MKSVLGPVGEVLCSRGNTWHHYLPACPLSTVEDSTHRRNQQPEDFSWADLGTLLSLNSMSFLSELLCVAIIATLQNLFQLKVSFCIHPTCREHGVVGDMRDAWPSARVRKNVALIRTYHAFKGTNKTLFTSPLMSH